MKKQRTTKDLFGNDVPIPQLNGRGQLKKQGRPTNFKAAAAHAELIAQHGAVLDKCRNCVHFAYKVFAKAYPKCRASGCDGSTRATDWSGLWQACGLFEKKTKPSNTN